MPPAISEDDSEQDLGTPARSAKAEHGKARKSYQKSVNQEVDEDEAMQESIAKGEGSDDAEEDEEEDDEEGEDEYVVEKIAGHMFNDAGEPMFHVKWEGYEKKSDMTWEPEDNLKENASVVLENYFKTIGGREKIFEDTSKALKHKKRGRPSTSGIPQTNNKRARKNGVDTEDDEIPATVRAAAWKPPAGSWEDEIEQLDACEDEETGKLMVYLTWKNGHKTQHETKVIYRRCPQKMLQFYERHVRIIKKHDVDADEAGESGGVDGDD